MSPVLAGLAVAIGVPILLFYVYGVVPVSLVKSTGPLAFVQRILRLHALRFNNKIE